MSQAIVYRLRQYDKIVGYCKTVGRYTFYSSDKLWWQGKSIAYNQKELEAPLRNQFGQKCFVNDVVLITDAKGSNRSAKQVINNAHGFLFRDLETGATELIKDEDNIQVKLLFAGLPSRTANRSLYKQIS